MKVLLLNGSPHAKGKCVFDDLVNEIAPKFEAADGLVVGTPAKQGWIWKECRPCARLRKI